MSNSTQEFWDIDGVSLNQFCWNITTFGGSRFALPPKRGDNTKYPNRHGRVFKPKKMDSRVITLQMWAIGISQNDEYVRDQELQFNDNWQALRTLLFNLDDTMTLTRRWRQTINGIPTLVEASAECELASTMDLAMTGRTRATFQVDLLLPDPLFYGEEISFNLEPNEIVEIFNPGDMPSYEGMSINFDGELWAPKVRNLSREPEVWVKANTLIQPSSYLSVDVSSFNAFRSYDSAVVTGSVLHSGAKPWFVLWPGVNQVKMESSGVSSGSATLKFRPAYL